MEILDERQLIWLIEDRIGDKMESLDKLSKRDLQIVSNYVLDQRLTSCI